MSDETATAVAEAPAKGPATVAAVFDDPFEGSPATAPVMEVLKEEVSRRISEKPEPKDDGQGGEEMEPEDILAQFAPDAQPQEAAEEGEAEDVDADFNAVLASLNELAGQALGVQAVPAPAAVAEPAPAPAPEPVVPITPMPVPASYAEELSYDELTDIITDPEKYKAHMDAFAQKVQMETMAQVQQTMVNTVFQVNRAQRLEERILKEYPDIAKNCMNLLVLSTQKAIQKFPQGDENVIFDELKKTIDPVLKKRGAIEKSGQKKDIRGRFAPAQATRTTRPNPTPARKDPTEEAFGMINALSSGPGSDLLKVFG